MQKLPNYLITFFGKIVYFFGTVHQISDNRKSFASKMNSYLVHSPCQKLHLQKRYISYRVILDIFQNFGLSMRIESVFVIYICYRFVHLVRISITKFVLDVHSLWRFPIYNSQIFLFSFSVFYYFIEIFESIIVFGSDYDSACILVQPKSKRWSESLRKSTL